MILNPFAVEKILASKCMTFSDLRPGVSPATVRRVRNGENIRADAAGRIARKLGVQVEDIVDEGC